MDKIKRQIECYVPITSCTLRCHYCYITHHRLFDTKLPQFPRSPEFIRQALSQKRLGGIAEINFCAGGETLLHPKILQYARALAEEGHYVSIVTNATVSKQFDILLTFPPEVTSHLFFKFSYHYLQLKEKGLLNTFFDNIDKARHAGCSFTLEITPSDELIPYINELSEMAIQRVGALPHCTIARDERAPERLPILTSMTRENYRNTWGVFQSNLFSFKDSIFEIPRTEFCYAGRWSLILDLGTGIAKQCYNSPFGQNIFEDISKPIQYFPIGCHCQEHHCYNGHHFLAWGLIPELNTPTYAEERNRTCLDGSEWLKPELKIFFSSKLFETNHEYNRLEKFLANWRMKVLLDHSRGNTIHRKARKFGLKCLRIIGI